MSDMTLIHRLRTEDGLSWRQIRDQVSPDAHPEAVRSEYRRWSDQRTLRGPLGNYNFPPPPSPSPIQPVQIHVSAKEALDPYLWADIGLTSVHYSCVHFPYHDPQTLDLLYQILTFTQPDLVVDHGDMVDCESISRFEKDPRNRVSLQQEIELAAEHIGQVTALTPDARHLWIYGNHEDRMRKLLWTMAGKRDQSDMLEVLNAYDRGDIASLTGAKELGWDTIPYRQHELLFDRLVLTHGNVVRQQSAYTARAEYDRYRKSGMSGHTHRRGVHEHRDYDNVNAWWELGCMCSIRSDYATQPNWQQGFAVVTWSDDRKEFGVEEVRIHDGRCFFRGRLFEATV